MTNIDKVIDEIWEYIYNNHNLNGVLLISREIFERELKLLKERNK